jgi:hypothetical protein
MSRLFLSHTRPGCLQSVFAAAAAPLASFERLPHVIFWVWLHVLQFDVSNQYLDPAEDALNKPDRPLPSGRITLRQAQILRWALVFICMALSACYSTPTVWSSVLLCLLTYTYNELHLHAGHWITRNLNNAFGFTSFELGATLVAGTYPSLKFFWLGVLLLIFICLLPVRGESKQNGPRSHACRRHQHGDLRDHHPNTGLQRLRWGSTYWPTDLTDCLTAVSTLHPPSHFIDMVDRPVSALGFECTICCPISRTSIASGAALYNDARHEV